MSNDDWELYKKHQVIEFTVECPKCGNLLYSYGDPDIICKDCNLYYSLTCSKANTTKVKNGVKYSKGDKIV